MLLSSQFYTHLLINNLTMNSLGCSWRFLITSVLNKFKYLIVFLVVTNDTGVSAYTSPRLQYQETSTQSVVQDEKGEIRPSHNCTTISCESSQPIRWEYDAHKVATLHKIIQSEQLYISEEYTTICYQSNITLNVPNCVYTGLYTCVAISQEYKDILGGQNNQTSMYLNRRELHEESSALGWIPTTALNKTITPWFGNIKQKLDKLGSPSTNERVILLTAISSIDGIDKCTLNKSEVIFQVNSLLHETSERSNDLVVQLDRNNITHPFTCKSNIVQEQPLRLQVFDCDNPNECNLLWETSPHYLRKGIFENVSPKSYSPLRQNGLVICSTEDDTKYQYVQYFRLENDEVILNSAPTNPLKLNAMFLYRDFLHPKEVHNTYLSVTERLKIICKASQYLFTHDLQLVVGYRNGSVLPATQIAIISNTSRNARHEYQWNVSVTSDDITSYICRAPFIKTNQSMSRSMEVTVLSPQPPKILANLSSPPDVVFYDNGLNVKLVCAAIGIPTPEIKWFQNNVKFPSGYDTAINGVDKTQTYGNANLIISTLGIPEMEVVGANIDGIWTCIASNGIQSDVNIASHVIYVTVRKSWWIWVVITMSMCAVIVVCTYVWQRYSRKKEIKGLRESLLPAKELSDFLREQKTLNNRLKLQLNIPVCNQGVEESNAVNDELIADPAKVSWNDDNIGDLAARAIPLPEEKFLNPVDLILSKYKVLGKGCHGIVIRGRFRESTNKIIKVAVKRPLTTSGPEKTKENTLALLKELKILSYVGTHEYVVRFIGLVLKRNSDEGIENLQAVLEMCEASLEDYFHKYPFRFVANVQRNIPINYTKNASRTYSTQDFIRWSFQIACAMQHLISRKIIHRDLAARNVLLFKKNGKLDVRITDFGLSKLGLTYDTTWGRKSLPWRHLAPELFGTSQKFSEATDFCSFGITMWEIFTLADKVPYHEFDRNDFRFINAIKNNRIRNSRPEYAEPEIYEIMCKCWDAEPTERPRFSRLIEMIKEHLPVGCFETIPSAAYELSGEGSAYKYIRGLLESNCSVQNGKETSKV